MILKQEIRITGAINSLAWSPDGNMLAWAPKSGGLEIHNVYRHNPISLELPDAALDVSWSPDTSRIACVTAAGAAFIYNIHSQDLRRVNVGFSDVPTWAVRFVSASVIVIGNAAGFILSYDLDNKVSSHWATVAGDVHALAWCQKTNILAVGSNKGFLKLIHFPYSEPVVLEDAIVAEDDISFLDWSPGGEYIVAAAGSNIITAPRVRLKERVIFEGHIASVWSALFSYDGELVFSDSIDGTVSAWNALSGERLFTGKARNSVHGNIAVHPSRSLLAYPNEDTRQLAIFEYDTAALKARGAEAQTTTYVSAKIVLAGESNVGKSCLAIRLAEGRYLEQGTTHGLKVWPLEPKMFGSAVGSAKEKRDIILWDMGGQDEYRLIHQLFLHDTTIALLLFDPTRGRTAFNEIEGWAKRFDRRQSDRGLVKLLVGTKLDHESSLLDQQEIRRFAEAHGFSAYIETSAKTGRGVPELIQAISAYLDWNSISRTSRPRLFQIVREEIEAARAKGEVILIGSELERRVQQLSGSDFEKGAVDAVINQLALQGVIAATRLSSRERALVLQIELIEVYAGAIVVAARKNPRGVPAIQENALLSPSMEFPGLSPAARIPHPQEKVVLECLVQLFLEHGICIEHEGLLVFPSLFRASEVDDKDDLPHAISLYYDFSGAIDNIYSSLVSWITVGEQFGSVRLGRGRAEFSRSGTDLCGLRKVERQRGFAHLDVYFDKDVAAATRNLFISVVEEHLRANGIHITEHVEITCKCGHRFSEDTVRRRIVEGQSDVGCPDCDRRILISEGATHARMHNPAVEFGTWALRSETKKKQRAAVERAKRTIARSGKQRANTEPLRVLHLSDIHFSASTDADVLLTPLITDLRSRENGLGFNTLDYLVVTGDLTSRAESVEFEGCRRFLSRLMSEFDLNAQRCIIVPGNHDLSWEVNAYNWVPRRKLRADQTPREYLVPQGDGFLVRDNDIYPRRFTNFSHQLFHKLLQMEYPFSVSEQGMVFTYPEDGLQFLTFNSSVEVDEFFPSRSGIAAGAISNAIRDLHRASPLNETAKQYLRLAVWHHPVTGAEKMKDDAFLGQLNQAGVRICLHGHVHEDRAELLNYLDQKRRLHVIGAGSFGARASDRPESAPRLYNVLEIDRKLTKLRVYTRAMRKLGGAWEPWAVWPGHHPIERLSYYDVEIGD